MARQRPKVSRPDRVTQSREFPVTVTRLPVVRCEACGQTMAHQPGQAGTVLTAHYERQHV
jgi:hypothetical protein